MTNEEYENAIARADDFLDMLKDTYHDQYDRIQELEKIIDKAIKYIESDYERNEEVIDYCNFDTFYNNLLKILKGVDE